MRDGMKSKIYKIVCAIMMVCLLMSNLTNASYAASNNTPNTKQTAQKSSSTLLDKLLSLLEEADSLKESDYTPESWEAFKDQRDTITEPEEIPEQFLDTVINTLQEAMDGLVKQESKLDKLLALLEEADRLKESDYTPESWEAFKDQRDTITEPEEIPEQFLDTVINALQEAMDRLVKNETTLEKLIALLAKADSLEESEYTRESWNAFLEVRNSITEPEEIPEQYQKMLLNSLQKAMDSLVKKEDDAKNHTQLEDGYYTVPLTENEPGRSMRSARALIKAENSNYEVTLQLAKATVDEGAFLGIMKQEYYNYDLSDYCLTGTKGWADDFDLQNSQFSQEIKDGAVEENNKYWFDYTREDKDEWVYLTFQVENLDDPFNITQLLKLGDGKRVSRSDTALNVQTSVKINLDEFQDITEIGFRAVYAASGADCQKYFLDTTAEWNIDGDTATGVFSLNLDLLDEDQAVIRDADGNDIDISTGKLELVYELNDYNDFVFGKSIVIYRKFAGGGIGFYDTCIIPELNGASTVQLKDDKTGTLLVTDSFVLPDSSQLLAEEIVDDPNDNVDAYSQIMNNISYSDMYMYNWKIQFQDGRETRRTTSTVQLKFKIPDSWNLDNVKLVNVDENMIISLDLKGTIEKTDSGNYFVIKTQELGYYALYEVKGSQDAGEMEDGTYTIPLSIMHLTNEGANSMANQCVDNNARLVVKGDEKILYLDYTTVTYLDMTSYMTKMWLYGEDMTMVGAYPTGTLIPVTFYSYYKNLDGSFFMDFANEGTLNYYPKSGYVKLVSDTAKWPARFKVPIMDEIGGGDFPQDAWLTLDWENAEKISNDTPDEPVKEALGQAITIAETAVREEYTQETWEALETAYAAAEEAYQTETAESMERAYTALMEAVNNLKSPDDVILNQGLYTALGSITDTDIVTDTRILVKEEGADISLGVQGIQSFQYYDLAEKQYVDAEMEKTTGDDGKETVTGAVFTLGTMSNSVSIKYVDIQGKEVQTALKFSDFAEQTVNKDALTETLNQANEKLKEAAENPDKYQADAVAELQKAVAMAAQTAQDPFALQTEADDQTEKVNTAISALIKDVNLDALKEAVTSAEAVLADAEKYTPASLEKLRGEIQNAKALLEDPNTSGQDVEAQLMKLQAAVEGLIVRADKTALQAAYDTAAAITNNDYPGWDNLQTALVNAKTVLDDENASQAQADEQTASLEAAVENLYGAVDKSQLKDLVEQAEKLDTSPYADKTVEFFKASIQSAKAVYNDTGATQTEVDKHLQLLKDASASMVQKEEENVVYDGTYTIDGRIWHAAANQASMGNAALRKPMQVIVKDGKATLRMEFGPLTTSGFTGYLAKLNYFPGWEGGESGYQMPTDETPISLDVEEYFEGVYDTYNDPDNGTDENVKGQLYPHYMTMPVDLGDGEVWVQVYVPVMEAINTGSGLQYAKLQIDWSTLSQTGGTQTDKTKLDTAIKSLETLKAELYAAAEKMKQAETENTDQADAQKTVLSAADFTQEKLNLLDKAIEAGKFVQDNVNVGQEAVDAMTKALNLSLIHI